MFEYTGVMFESPLVAAHRQLIAAVEQLCAATESGPSDADLLSVLTLCEGTTRRLDRLTVGAVSALERRGSFSERGYRGTAAALSDLLGWERFESRRRVTAAEHICPRTGLDGTTLPARLPGTAEVFDAGQTSLRHVEAVAKVLATPAAERLTAEVWAAAELQLADKASVYTPTELHSWGTSLVEALDQDGAEPDDRPPPQVNELHLTRRNSGGGVLKGRIDDAAMFDTIATLIDAKAKPTGSEDDRSIGQRQAEALADVCGYVLDHGEVPECGGRRPHLNVHIRLDDLENRCRAATLDFGGRLTPESLRMLACDAAVTPIVLGGQGQPLDVGRITRTIPDGLRRAVAARDHGCARPGCGRPASWCEVHHIIAWQDGGDTALHNCVMLCKRCHRLIHHSGWQVHIRNGLPEFLPPAWIDPDRIPRRRPLPHLVPTS
jgi:5-methylcytosine-specific restriction protein A